MYCFIDCLQQCAKDHCKTQNSLRKSQRTCLPAVINSRNAERNIFPPMTANKQKFSALVCEVARSTTPPYSTSQGLSPRSSNGVQTQSYLKHSFQSEVQLYEKVILHHLTRITVCPGVLGLNTLWSHIEWPVVRAQPHNLQCFPQLPTPSRRIENAMQYPLSSTQMCLESRYQFD